MPTQPALAEAGGKHSGTAGVHLSGWSRVLLLFVVCCLLNVPAVCYISSCCCCLLNVPAECYVSCCCLLFA